jgi:hypothetical protein
MRHFLNEIEITPRNREVIGVVSDFTDNPEVLKVNVDTIILPREAYDIVKDHINTIGLFEGIPYRVQMANGISLDYYVDLTSAPVFRSYECELKIKRRRANDNFFDNANGTSFELLLAKGVVFPTFKVPYLIVKDNQVELSIMLSLALFNMTQASIQAIKDLAETISEGAAAFTPSIGVTGPVINIGAIVKYYISVTIQIIYIASLLIAITEMAVKLFSLIFPKVRNLLGCNVKDLIEKGCNYLGFTLDSTLLSTENWTVLPVPLVRGRKGIFKFVPDDLISPFNKGVPSSSDTVSTLGSLIKAVEDTFNARTKVINGVVQIERRDYWNNVAINNIIPAMVIQADRQDEYSYNPEDVWKRYYIHYQLDQMDLNTMDELYDIHDSEYSSEAVNVLNADLVTIKGLNDVAPPFALGQRKDELNWIELIAKGLFGVIDALTGLFGGGTNLVAKIDARVGVLVISQNFFAVTKLLYTINGKQPANFKDIVSAKGLWSNYHYINQIALNSWKIKSDVRLRIMEEDFVTLLNNNWIEVDGVNCEILRLEWIDEKSLATLTYKIPDNFANGKVSTLIINE